MSNKAGYTFVEILMALSVLGIILMSTGALSAAGYDAQKVTRENTELESKASRCANRVAAELMASSNTVMFPDSADEFGTEVVNFRQPVGLNGAGILWGPLNRLTWEYDPNEVDDGLDNDGDGLVDEGQLVLVRNVGDANERRTVLTRGVAEMGAGEILDGADNNGNGVIDEGGFNVRRVGTVLQVRLQLQDLDGGRLIERSIDTAVRMRN